ncbi:CHAT domain-containing protein [Streptomyces sp. NPDC048297]|uniref:CHAT domain-containing protein n=1 Tax=Streptomyces sp. NPDC048297 TaxID=3365531 RepID=UPI0037143782
MNDTPLTALRAHIERFASTFDPQQVLGPEAEAAAAGLAESLGSAWSDEAAHVLGWFHWFRCMARNSFEGTDFHQALAFFRPLWRRMPDAVPDALDAVFAREAREQASAQPLEEALRLGDQATEHATAYRTTGDPAHLDAAVALLERGIGMLREIGALPEMLQINLVEVLLRRHARDGDPDSLEAAVGWTARTIDSLASVIDEQAVALLAPLGGNLLTAHQRPAPGVAGRDPRLLSLAVAAWDRVQEKSEDPQIRVQVRLRLAAALIEDHLRTPREEWVRQAGAYVERAADECDPADTRARDVLGTLLKVVPLAVAQANPALLHARARVLRGLVAHTASGDGQRRAYRADLGMCLRMTYEATREAAALDEAVEVLRAALSGADGTGPAAVSWMAGLANALKSRVDGRRTGSLGSGSGTDSHDDIAEAERWARRAQELAPADTLAVSSLGNVLRVKALLLRDVGALRESAGLNHAAARLLDPSHPAYMAQLMNAGLSHKELAQATGGLADADNAVTVLRTAAERLDSRHPDHAPVRVELGHSLTLRGELGHDSEAVAEGRRLLESVVAELPGDHVEVRRTRHNLIDCYRVEFQLTRDESALDEALRLARGYLDDPTLNDDERRRLLGTCVGALMAAYGSTWDRRLLDELLPVCRSAVRFAPEGSFDRCLSLLELGVCLTWVYEVSRDSTALLEAMDVLEEAASGPDGWRTTPDAMARLAEARMQHTRQFASIMAMARRARESAPDLFTDVFAEPLAAYEHELDAIVDLGRTSLALRAPDSRGRPVSLSYLAIVLLGRARDRSSAQDAREAVELLREAVRTSDADDPDWPVRATNLGAALAEVHRHDGAPSLLDEAESVTREAVARANADDHRHVRALMTLSRVLARRGDAREDWGAEALDLRRRVHRTAHFPLPERLAAAEAAADLAAGLGDWEGAATDYEAAVDLLPRLVGHRLDRSDRELLLTDELLLASQAAACALQLDDPLRALDLLERGRGILLGQLTETRRDLSDLRRQAPELAEEFSRLGEAMTSFGAVDDRDPGEVPGSARDTHRLTVRSWERVRDEIRGLPGFGSFLRPGVPDLGELTVDGPVVVVNLARRRSDAIVIAEGTAVCVPLPRADLRSAGEWFEAFRLAVGSLHDPAESAEQRWEAGIVVQETLTWLWEAIAEPVVRHLGLEPGGDPLPRLWWCPTGILSLMPLHAAGRYTKGAENGEEDGNGDKDRNGTWEGIADFAMSSYTTTLDALRPKGTEHDGSRLSPRSPLSPLSPLSRVGDDPRLLVVATPEAPGATPLRHAAADAQALAELFPRTTVLTGDAATKQAVLRELTAHSWAHFACHAQADAFARTANELVLQNGSLTLPDISKLSLDAEFAFLASCGSAAGSYYLADEAHHVASSFQLAGFTHVIATLWEVADGDATGFTATLYGLMAQGAAPAEALHRATRDLRVRYPLSPWLWAPYVHMGP